MGQIIPERRVRRRNAPWRPIRWIQRFGAALLVCFIVALSAGPAKSAVRPQDSIWLVNSRGASGCCAAGECAQSFSYSKYGADCQWSGSGLAEFLAEDLQYDKTIVFVHGNRIEPGQDRSGGLAAYAALVPQDDARHVRFVIFSWPAGQIRGPLRDFREKATRTIPAAHHLGALLVEFDPRTPLGLLGYSYGGPIVTGGLHLAAGGSLYSRRLGENPAGPLEDVHTVLIVPAQDRRTIADGGLHGQAGTLVDHMLIVTNCCDPAMKFYHLVEKHGRPVALGLAGLSGYRAEWLGGKVELLNACPHVGKSHDLENHLCSPTVMAATWSALAGDDAPSEPVAPVVSPLDASPSDATPETLLAPPTNAL